MAAVTGTDLMAPAPTYGRRIRAYLEKVLPPAIAELLKNGLGPLAAWVAVGFVGIMLLPLLSILALALLVKVLPAKAGQSIHDSFVAAIQSGYDIDKVRAQLKKDTEESVVAKLTHNNESLDYVQYLEFYLTKADAAKEIPTRLHMGQRAEISIRRSQVVRNPDSHDAACALVDVAGSQAVLYVHLDGFPVRELPAMSSPGPLGEIHLQKKWWDQNMKRLQAEPTIAADNIASVFFGKTPAFEQLMTECTALKIEATVEVFKQDVGAGT